MLLSKLDTGDSSDCYELQRAIILGRLESERSCGSAVTIVRDRTVDEDLAVFAAMHFANGLISAKQLDELRALALEVSNTVGTPDAYVLLSCEQHILRDRILAAKAPGYIVKTLSDQVRLYEEWSSSVRAPFVRLNTSRIKPQDLSPYSAWILQTVSEARAGTTLRNENLGIAWAS
jgi:deoxyadenosine/deoxycytidine kinase